jgi:hypothetical protein
VAICCVPPLVLMTLFSLFALFAREEGFQSCVIAPGGTVRTDDLHQAHFLPCHSATEVRCQVTQCSHVSDVGARQGAVVQADEAVPVLLDSH